MKVPSAALVSALVATVCGAAFAGSLTLGFNYSTTTNNSGFGVAIERTIRTQGKAPLAASNGMTLYTFDRDNTGVSNCYNECAQSWPPFRAAAKATPPSGAYSKIHRKDGTFQWAKHSAPLYFWIGDTKPGDALGDGLGGLWHVAY